MSKHSYHRRRRLRQKIKKEEAKRKKVHKRHDINQVIDEELDYTYQNDVDTKSY